MNVAGVGPLVVVEEDVRRLRYDGAQAVELAVDDCCGCDCEVAAVDIAKASGPAVADVEPEEVVDLGGEESGLEGALLIATVYIATVHSV